MKRFLNIGLIISFLGCYIDWGHDGKEFIFQTQLYFFSILTEQPTIFDFTLLTGILIGELSLAFGTISKNNIAYKRLTILGLTFLTTIVILVVFMSLMASNWISVLSTTPYILFTLLTIRTLLNRQIL